MTINIKCGNNTFKDIDLLLVDVSGTLLDYKELWLKQVGYIAQTLAENHSKVQGELFRTRAMVMKVLGVDPESAEIDFTSSMHCSSNSELIAVLSAILYINRVNWSVSFDSVVKTLAKMEKDIDFRPVTKLYPDTTPFLSKFTKEIKVITFAKRQYEDSEKILSHHNLLKLLAKNYSLHNMNIKDLSTIENQFLACICKDQNVKPERTLVVADSIYDLSLNENGTYNRLVVNRNVIDVNFYKPFGINYIVNSLSEIVIT